MIFCESLFLQPLREISSVPLPFSLCRLLIVSVFVSQPHAHPDAYHGNAAEKS